jgi:regulator of RNase E activity RraA
VPEARPHAWREQYCLRAQLPRGIVVTSVPELIDRLLKIQVAAVSDVLDKRGLWEQHLPHQIKPLDNAQKVAGPAFTIKGQSTAQLDVGLGPKVIDSLTPDCVVVWDTTGEQRASHWGDLMGAAAKAKGARGVVIDGGVRDIQELLGMSFPVFARYRTAAGTPGRWKITEINEPVRIDGVLIRPGDFIFGDLDGIVVIPAEIVEEVVTEAEIVQAAELKIREAVEAGGHLATIYGQSGLLERTQN